MAFGFSQIRNMLRGIPVPSPSQRRVLVRAMMSTPSARLGRAVGGAIRRQAPGIARGLGQAARRGATIAPSVTGRTVRGAIGGAVRGASRFILPKVRVPRFKAGGTAVKRSQSLRSTLRSIDRYR